MRLMPESLSIRVLCGALVGTLGIVVIGFEAEKSSAPIVAPPPLARARYAQTAGENGVAPLVRVQLDATHTSSASSEALDKVLGGMISGGSANSYSAHAPKGETAPVSSGKYSGPNWLQWGHFSGPRADCKIVTPAGFPVDGISGYACAGAENITICIANHSGKPVRTQLQARLPHGIYTVERLVFSTTSASESALEAKSEAAKTEALNRTPDGDNGRTPVVAEEGLHSDGTVKLDRLEGCDLGHTASITKPGVLKPGQVVFYRYTDQSRVVRLAMTEAYRQMHLLALRKPGPIRRLQRMLDEGAPFVGAIRATGGSETASRLGAIHHLLLVTAQAQSLHHNYQIRKTIDPDTGAPLMGALERLMDSLSETSATLLGLVPQVHVEEAGPAMSANENKTENKTENKAESKTVSTRSSDRQFRRRTITVSLRNTGAHSVNMVKLGLDGSALPPGTACEPYDPEFFGTVGPGQTVRATFNLRYPADHTVADNLCVADVCYFAGGGPAHLRPRPW